MRTLTIKRGAVQLGEPKDARILSDERVVGEIKAQEKTKTLPLSKGEHSVQFEMTGEDGLVHRSNAYFAVGKKDVVLFMDVSGSRLTLRKENC